MSDPVEVMLLDETVHFSLAELCSACNVAEAIVLEIVAEGIVEPRGSAPSEWLFSGLAVARIQRVVRLQSEFGVNLPGAALALELLEEVERLRRAQR
jgi:chaperone modulatory protein CbpM